MTKDVSPALWVRMQLLASYAGWHTVPHPLDHVLVRLALRTARERHDPNRGGDPEMTPAIDSIEDAWLEWAL